MTTTITRHVEFDAGHRVPDHASKCRHPHGHRYKLEVTVEGPVIDEPGASDHGMVCDFGVLGDALDKVAREYDHAFLVSRTDTVMRDFLNANDFAQVVIWEGPPTAEVLVERMTLDLRLPANVRLVEATLWETPKCRATYSP